LMFRRGARPHTGAPAAVCDARRKRISAVAGRGDRRVFGFGEVGIGHSAGAGIGRDGDGGRRRPTMQTYDQ
jgi:hypothetical protein